MPKDNILNLKQTNKEKINIEERLIKIIKCKVCSHEKDKNDPKYCNYCAMETDNDEMHL